MAASYSRYKQDRARYIALEADSNTAQMITGCPVVTIKGESIGSVERILIDSKTRLMRYIAVRQRKGAPVFVPWSSLYFDAGLHRLVFYTLVSA